MKALAVALYGEGVMSNVRIAAFLTAAGGGALGLSEGSVYSFCRKLAEASKESIRNLEVSLLNRKIVATDATTVTVSGKQNYIRNFSMGDTVVYHAMNSKSIPALEKLPFLRKFSGILLHDFDVPFDDNISERDLRKAKNR